MSALISCSNFNDLLSLATARLNLNSAARKVFVKGGQRVTNWGDIKRLQEGSEGQNVCPQLYISMGEPYMNPYKYINGEQ